MNTDTRKLLKNSNLKVTKPRLVILGEFQAECEPIDAESLYGKVKKQRIDKVTVYRTLSTFEKSGILRRVDLRKDSVHYEIAHDHHHHHIVCTDCGVLESFEQCLVSTKEVLKNSKKFKIIQDHALELYGMCKSCEVRS